MSPGRDGPARGGWAAALLPLAVLAVFAPGLGGRSLNWDDVQYIRNSPYMRDAGGLAHFWRPGPPSDSYPQYFPLTFTSYWLEYRLWGDWPTGYFAVNVLLHAANSVLVYRLVRRLGGGAGTAWLVGAIFAIHPLQVASVSWIAQRKNTLCGLFFLVSFLLYLRHVRSRRTGAYVASLVAFAAALLSKTLAATLPVSLLLAEYIVLRQRGWGPIRRTLPMLALATGLGVLVLLRERASVAGLAAFSPQPLAAAAALWFYLGKAVWPGTLLALYPRWSVSPTEWTWWLPVAGLLLAIVLLVRFHRRIGPLPLWGVAYFAVTLAPVLGLIPFGHLTGAPVADHFVYLALPGAALALVVGAQAALARVRAGPAAAGVLAGLVLVLLATRTSVEVQRWRSGTRLWAHTVAHNPASVPAHTNLGVALAEEGRLEEALRSFQEAGRRDPRYRLARANAGMILRSLGRLTEAEAEFRAVVDIAPRDATAHVNLASTLEQRGDRAGAAEHYRIAAELQPGNARIHANLGGLLVDLGQVEAGRAELERALRVDPDDVLGHVNAGVLAAREGRLAEAESHWTAAIRRDADNFEARMNYAALLVRTQRAAAGLTHLLVAERLRPDHPAIGEALALTYATLGRMPEAIAAAERGLAQAQLRGDTALAGRLTDLLVRLRAASGQPPAP